MIANHLHFLLEFFLQVLESERDAVHKQTFPLPVADYVGGKREEHFGAVFEEELVGAVAKSKDMHSHAFPEAFYAGLNGAVVDRSRCALTLSFVFQIREFIPQASAVM